VAAGLNRDRVTGFLADDRARDLDEGRHGGGERRLGDVHALGRRLKFNSSATARK
jgi:hypothetical protein